VSTILAIETSCDETAVAILRGNQLLASEVASQIAEHKPYGGVVPEVASRNHLRHAPLLLGRTAKNAGISLAQIDAFAATSGPGLASSLMIGASIAASGLVTFKKAGTTTIPGQLSSQLVTWGPYRFSRNPMYVGLTIAYLGEAGILTHVWSVVLLPLILVYLNFGVIPVEESKLRQVFGEEYEHYQMAVRRWI